MQALMDAGREMDAKVATKVMGHRTWQERPDMDYDTRVSVPTEPGTVEDWDKVDLPAYSTDIAAAWQVVEYMRSTDHGMELWRPNTDGFSFLYQVKFYGGGCEHVGQAESAALAICRAALAAEEVHSS